MPTATSAPNAMAAISVLFERKIGGIEKAERGARVAHVGEVQKSRHNRHAGMQRQQLTHHGLGHLIDGDHQDRHPDLEAAPGAGLPLIH